jgi:heat shock protein HtpX
MLASVANSGARLAMLVFGSPTMLVRRRLAPLDPAERRRHKIRNVIQSVLLLGGMVVLLGLCGWLVFGPEGMLGMAIGTGLAPRHRLVLLAKETVAAENCRKIRSTDG